MNSIYIPIVISVILIALVIIAINKINEDREIGPMVTGAVVIGGTVWLWWYLIKLLLEKW